MAEALSGLSTYATRSADGLGRMRDSMQDAMRSVKTPLDAYSKDIQSFLPMFGLSESMRLGRDSGRLWDEGNYGDSLITMGNAIDAPLSDALWFVPGAGLIRKLPK